MTERKRSSAGAGSVRKRSSRDRLRALHDGPRTVDIILRTANGETADDRNTGVVGLYRMHKEVEARKEGESNDRDSTGSADAIKASDKAAARLGAERTKSGNIGTGSMRARSKSRAGTGSNAMPAVPSRPTQRGRSGTIGKSGSSRRGSVMPPAYVIGGPAKAHMSHVAVEYHACIVPTNEPLQMYVALYSDVEGRMITESWYLPTDAAGFPNGIKNLFRSIPTAQLRDSKMYLVVRLFRQGPVVFMEDKEKERKKYKIRPTIRRPVGVAVVSLEELIENGRADVAMDVKVAPSEKEYPNLHKLVIKARAAGKDFETLPKSKGISMTLVLYNCDETVLGKMVPDFRQYSFSKRLDFPDVLMPNDDRHDLYLTMVNADFPEAGSKTVQYTVMVNFNDSDESVPMCIASSGEQLTHQFTGFVLNSDKSPKYLETLKICVPADLYDKAHVFIRFNPVKASNSAIENAFGFAFIPLTDLDGTALNDGPRKLPLYKTSVNVPSPKLYLGYPNNPKAPVRKDTVNVSIALRSTHLTQNPFLRRLLNWKQAPNEIAEVLRKFTFIDQFEIVKFLREIFDALFAIVAERAADADFLVYDALVFIIGLLVDDKAAKFQNFRPILDSYIERKFSGDGAYSVLMNCLKFYLGKADSPQHAGNVRSSMKALEYIFKFIIASRQLYDRNTGGKRAGEFQGQLHELLGAINELMRRTSPDWVIGSQTLALKYFANVFHDLSSVYDAKALSQIAVDFIKSVQHSDKKQLNLEKLYMLRRLANTELFLSDASRGLVMPELVLQLKMHFKRGAEEAAAAVPVVSEMIDSVQKRSANPQAAINDLQAMIPLILQNLNNTFKDVSQARSEVVTAFLAIFELMSEEQIIAFFNARTSKAQFLTDTFKFLHAAQTTPIYPGTWIMMRIFQYRASNKILKTFAPVLGRHFVSLNTFSFAMFDWFFKASVALLSQDLLQYESFPAQKAHFLEARCPDMRLSGAQTLNRVWDAIGKNQAQFIPAIVSPFLELATNGDPQARLIGINLYGSLLEREFKESGSFQKVARRTFDALQTIIDNVNVDASFRRDLISNLEQRIKRNQAIQRKGKSFVQDLNQLIGFMMALRSCPATPEFEDERTLAMLKLMTYLKKTDRMDMYVVYVEKLRELHTGLKNYTEAGLTLLLYAHLLPWSDQKLDAAGPHPPEEARVRKERLIKQAIALFDQGKTWERAIALIRDLRQEFEQQQNPQLESILNEETKYLEKIMEHGGGRFFAEYFRVAYYGKNFPSSYQNKEFVYRGLELERLGEFVTRIGRKFPNAEVLKLDSPGPPPRDIITANRQFLQITKVEPSSKEQMEGLAPKVDTRLPEAVRKYVLLNDVNVFKFERPWTKQKGKLSDRDMIRYTYSLVTYLVTQDTFPSYLRRSEVVERYEVELSPVDVALQSIVSKNEELTNTIAKNEKEGADLDKAKANINQFTMQLNGVIDAAVAGGPTMYKDIFYTRAYMDKHPDKLEALEALRAALRDQLSILQRGLMVHRRICPPELLPLQEKMEKFFAELKKSLAVVVSGQYMNQM